MAHVIAAVASSSGKDRAERFRCDLHIPETCATYGSYNDLVEDPNVDLVYVASPHSHHFQHTLLALEAGKHVVCEKPLTVNAAQAKVLYKTAKEKNLFLLDAVWTRYFPLSFQVRESIQRGEVGEVLRIIADTSFGIHPDIALKETPRKLTHDLAGGALLESKSIHFQRLGARNFRFDFRCRVQLAFIPSHGYFRPFTTLYHEISANLLPVSCRT